MASITLYNENGKLVCLDKGHKHDGMDPHVHEIDLSKINFEDIEKLERESRNGNIEIWTWKQIPGAVITREPTKFELEQIRRFM